MAKQRPRKTDHLIYADHTGSRGKSGVWFGERAEFKELQGSVMEALKERMDWVALDGAVLAIDAEPPGITIIAPNPSLPGVIVLADGSTPASSELLKAKYVELVRAVIAELSTKQE